MKYILLTELDDVLESLDDALYSARTRSSLGPGDPEATSEMFSEGDLLRIRENMPKGADAIALTEDDWQYWDSKSNKLLGKVFT